MTNTRKRKAPRPCPYCGRATAIRAGLVVCDTCGGLEGISLATVPPRGAAGGRRLPVMYSDSE